jgi:hypothetical protein
MQNIMRLDFEKIYKTNGFQGEESVSGPGSSLHKTRFLKKKLEMFFEEYNIQSMIDIPCGDYNWMRHVEMPTAMQYLGADIVQELIDRNNALYGPQRTFRVMNIIRDILPESNLIFCRDCFVHLPFPDIFLAIKSKIESKSSWLMLTTFPRVTANQELTNGIWRPLNMQMPPFCFPKPVNIFEEAPEIDKNNPFSDKSIGLWRIASLPEFFGQHPALLA